MFAIKNRTFLQNIYSNFKNPKNPMKINLFQLQKYPWGKEVIQRKNRIEKRIMFVFRQLVFSKIEEK